MSCKDLWGIDNDYKHWQELCDTFNYDLFPKKEKYQWTQNELIDFLEKKAKYYSEKIDKYDSLFVSVSGHGWNNGIITSDYQLVTKRSIHAIFSWKYANLKPHPRVFTFDCCDGEQERDYNFAGYHDNFEEESSSSSSSSEVMTEEEEQYIGKNFDNDDIKLERQNSLVW